MNFPIVLRIDLPIADTNVSCTVCARGNLILPPREGDVVTLHGLEPDQDCKGLDLRFKWVEESISEKFIYVYADDVDSSIFDEDPRNLSEYISQYFVEHGWQLCNDSGIPI